jgi:hypothetical protein
MFTTAEPVRAGLGTDAERNDLRGELLASVPDRLS